MATRSRSVPENVPGEFFVDSTCIDCDTCRQVAPAVFAEADSHAFVHQQPGSPAELRQALRALVCCPTGSIGCTGSELRPASVLDDFPLPIHGGVSYCGFTSPRSYGGSSYFVQHEEGNWLVDSPKFLPRLVARLEQLGGVKHLFLTHSDDVADAERYAKHFGARRIIHRAELHSQPNSECVLDGDEPILLAPDFLAIPTPGHTRGHCVLLVQQRYLFTGDHLAWDRHGQQLMAYRDHCWYSWEHQIASMAHLAEFGFEWVLPGHGQRVQLPRDVMREQMCQLVLRMRLG